MSLRNIDVGSALRRIAEQRIEEAVSDGKFDSNPLAGKPLELEPLPADENARMMWWALRILRNNGVIPDEVRWRKEVDGLRAELSATRDLNDAAKLIAKINALVKQINTLGTNALNAPVAPIDPEAELNARRA